jgi:hypothetical protein
MKTKMLLCTLIYLNIKQESRKAGKQESRKQKAGKQYVQGLNGRCG